MAVHYFSAYMEFAFGEFGCQDFKKKLNIDKETVQVTCLIKTNSQSRWGKLFLIDRRSGSIFFLYDSFSFPSVFSFYLKNYHLCLVILGHIFAVLLVVQCVRISIGLIKLVFSFIFLKILIC